MINIIIFKHFFLSLRRKKIRFKSFHIYFPDISWFLKKINECMSCWKIIDPSLGVEINQKKTVLWDCFLSSHPPILFSSEIILFQPEIINLLSHCGLWTHWYLNNFKIEKLEGGFCTGPERSLREFIKVELSIFFSPLIWFGQ